MAVPTYIPETDHHAAQSRPSQDHVQELGKLGTQVTGEPASERSLPSDIDADGEVKQDGVRRTEAMTATWDKKTLVTMFILYGHLLHQAHRIADHADSTSPNLSNNSSRLSNRT